MGKDSIAYVPLEADIERISLSKEEENSSAVSSSATSPSQQFSLLHQFNQDYLGDDEEIDEFLEEQQNLYLQKKQSAITPQELREKRLQTLCYCMNYVSLGLALGCIGPTLVEISEMTHTSEDKAGSTILAARGIGWIVGSAVAGALYERVRGNRIMWISMFVLTIFMLMIPLIPNLWILVGISALMGSFMSCTEVGVNTLTIWVWKDKVAPYMQLLHFAFGLGLGVGPFIVGVVVKVVGDKYALLASYWTMAVFIALSAILPLRLKSPPIEKEFNDAHAVHSTAQISSEGKNDNLEEITYFLDGNSPKSQQQFRYYVVVVLVTAFFFLYGGSETAFGNWISTYATKKYSFSTSEAAYLNAGYWAALTLGRLVAVPLAVRVPGRILLAGDLFGCLTSMSVLIVYAHYRYKWLLWFATLMFGASMASIFATVFSLPSELKVKATSKATSAFIISSGIGDMTLPILVGWIINPSMLGLAGFLWSLVFVFFLCTVLYISLFVYGLSTMEKRLDETELNELNQLAASWSSKVKNQDKIFFGSFPSPPHINFHDMKEAFKLPQINWNL